MHIQSALLALSGAVLVSAKGLVVPEGQANGFYSFDIDTGVIFDHQPLANLTDVTLKEKRAALAFPHNYRHGCVEAWTPLGTTEHIAWSMMTEFCENRGAGSVWKRSGHYVNYDGIVWYMCNYSYNGDQGCNRGEMDEAGTIIGQECRDHGGWVGIDDWAKMYGRDGAGKPICSGLPLSNA